MAAELARHLGVPGPASRILLKQHDVAEWQELTQAAAKKCPALLEMLEKKVGTCWNMLELWTALRIQFAAKSCMKIWNPALIGLKSANIEGAWILYWSIHPIFCLSFFEFKLGPSEGSNPILTAWYSIIGGSDHIITMVLASNYHSYERSTCGGPWFGGGEQLETLKVSMLLLQYVPGKSLDHEEEEAFLPPNLPSACKALGKLFTLDSGCWCGMCVLIFHLVVLHDHLYSPVSGTILFVFPGKTKGWSFSAIFHVGGWTTNQDLLLGNADRLPIQSLGWAWQSSQYHLDPWTLRSHRRRGGAKASKAVGPGHGSEGHGRGFRMLQRWSKMGTHQMIIEVIDPFSQTCSDLLAWSTWFWETVACFLAGRESESTSLPFAYPDLSHSISVHPPKITLPSHLLCYISLTNSNNILGYPNIYNNIITIYPNLLSLSISYIIYFLFLPIWLSQVHQSPVPMSRRPGFWS